MNRWRKLYAVVGAGVFLLGLLTVLSPSVAGAIPIDGLVAFLGGPYILLATVGVIAFVVAVSVLVARSIEGIDESTPPDPEDVYRVPHPGHDFDEFVDGGLRLRLSLFRDRHARVRARLQRTAMATLMRADGLDRTEAREAVATGAWTDDDLAASFLSERHTPDVGERLVAAVRGESPFQHGARRAAEALARYDDGGRSRYDDGGRSP